MRAIQALLPAALLTGVLSLACSGGGGASSAAPAAPAPTAAFSVSPAAPVAQQTVQFTDTSTGGPTSWTWSFGDGGTSALRSPGHAFAAAGTFTVTLTAANASGSATATRTVAVGPAATAPAAAFTFSPAAPTVGQAVGFADASTGSPATWSWDFGDGTTSAAQNPTHAFTAAGAFTVTLAAANATGSTTATRTVTVGPAGPGPLGSFRGSIVLGAPTGTSIRAKVLTPDQRGTVSLQAGTAPGVYTRQTPAAALVAGTPVELALAGLAPDTRHYYRLDFQSADGSGSGPTAEYTFHTARPAGSTFTFCVQADSHLDENSDLATYQRALGNILADGPDFHVDLGDTFMCEKHAAPLTAVVQSAPDQATVNARYAYERANFGLATHSAPLFLVNGNHEGETGWIANGTAQSLAVWTSLARLNYFVNPFPDAFYTGDGALEPFVGKRASWYAWHWGDALFVVLDPFWNSKVQASQDGWNLTLGSAQYQWLQQTLAASPATFKFVFIHNLVGGLDGQMRGGIEAAPFFEWGGRSLDGTAAFAQRRSGWAKPIHQLLVQHGVTAVFHGHDHLYAKQDLDGIVYQEVPQPSARNFQSGTALAAEYHYASGTILSSSGHLRVTVAPGSVTARYIRAWLPSQETATRKNGQVDDAWTVLAPARREGP